MGNTTRLRPVVAWLHQTYADGTERRVVAGVLSPYDPGELVAVDEVADFATVVTRDTAQIHGELATLVHAAVVKRELAGLDGELSELIGETSG